MAGQFDRIVLPGETGKIPINVKTTSVSGTLTKSITVTTNVQDPAKAVIILKVKGQVWQPVQVTPRSAAFGRISLDKVEEKPFRKLTIVSNVEGELKLTGIKSTNPAFGAEVTPIEPGKKYELVISIIAPLKSGNNTGKINISTGIAETPKLVIPVYAYVTSPVDVTPAKLALPMVRSQDLTRHFYIRSNNNKPLKISDLKSSNPDLKLQLTDIRNALTYRLTVDVPVSYKPSSDGDTISFKTDNSFVPLVSIPITVRRPIAKRPNNYVRTKTGGNPPSITRGVRNIKGPLPPKPAAQAGAGASKAAGGPAPTTTEKKGSQPAGN